MQVVRFDYSRAASFFAVTMAPAAYNQCPQKNQSLEAPVPSFCQNSLLFQGGYNT